MSSRKKVSALSYFFKDGFLSDKTKPAIFRMAYTELVPEIADEPNYEAALAAVKQTA